MNPSTWGSKVSSETGKMKLRNYYRVSKTEPLQNPKSDLGVPKEGKHSGKRADPIEYGSFAVKDEIFCLIEGCLDNLRSLRQEYGLAKTANEVNMMIESYKALRDRAPYPPSHVIRACLDGLLSWSNRLKSQFLTY
ncbi:hypothetical protein H5410_032347 [Solanum commersonii]|uniref:DUF3700 domain-containing protein n=1 Tax=Solanum commersonii TaxID=4109 RepID=A0A9J5YKU3_SOLCO|nr:hypothetical protein H5410_032347 [Solanum commersonii]